MTTWDPNRYLRYADERSRPFVDLVARVDGEPRTIVDLGCGPGHLTAVLRSRWPDATVLGVDSSPEMIDRATADNADDRASYELADVATWVPQAPVDLIVSNALFQWVPDQLAVIERLSGHVAPGGTFALQTPNNYSGPSHRLLSEIASRPAYRELTEGLHDDRGTSPETYLDLFVRAGWQADVWETSYLHVLHGDDPVLDWISGTGARPVLAALPEGLRADFVAEYGAALRAAYPARTWGTVMPFARVFAVARRSR
ncbi:methyltransferase domain-containing protein [Aeromicrobium fastidiosum]|uniref:Methyltransferase domain-containing protein n=1 Tax=Aeromicrobium fastidiosum TaxID=52699 RepID=A0A641ALS9_9ACTN|nr:methyltransferase domain-containing protein [Aeromicrobium fastidiosum]KAA1378089.1 methyltransferase domain-containing protein [Aeromicrobium fastidiosum]MBP2389116.1 trans-aconitate 2-methyltransferase [Aeromicrobium fastidiosum]